jgi:hypothetical protein
MADEMSKAWSQLKSAEDQNHTLHSFIKSLKDQHMLELTHLRQNLVEAHREQQQKLKTHVVHLTRQVDYLQSTVLAEA